MGKAEENKTRQRKHDEVLVGSGSFRIDPKRALEVLRESQLAVKENGMALWVRAAVLRGAKRADFVFWPFSMTIRFGGKPLTAAEMKDPFSVLLSGSSADPASRWLAVALVHTSIPMMRLTVESGPADSRMVMVLDDDGFHAAEPASHSPSSSADTVVKARWKVEADLERYPLSSSWDALELRSALEPCPMAVWTPQNDRFSYLIEPAQPDKRGGLLKDVHKGGLRILLRPREVPGIEVRFCVAGVAVEGSAAIPFPVPWSAWVDDLQLELDASLKSAVQGERWHAALKAVEEAAREHSLAMMERHARVMRLVGGLLMANPGLVPEWRRLRSLSLASLAACFKKDRRTGRLRRLFGGKLSGDRLRMLECAMTCVHLHEPADAVSTDPERKGRDPLKTALWRVPLYFDKEGEPRSVEDLCDMKKSFGPPL
ncbi:MAG: hypothetical protein HY927_01605 [Elusimicrobia bacterium]|nr:hypothetical protein [Elusimicrobiota bacterium]